MYKNFTEDSFPLEAEHMAVDTGRDKPMAVIIIHVLNQRKKLPCRRFSV